MIRQPYLLLGESPNEATVGRPELWLRPDRSGIRHSANRLLDFTGFEMTQFLCLFARDNLVHELPPRDGKGRAFPRDIAERNALRVRDFILDCEFRGVLILGRRVASQFRFCAGKTRAGSSHPYLTWAACWPRQDSTRAFRAVIVPHPSGVNQWWNSEENRAAARTFFENLT